MTRRQFLAASGASTAALALPAHAQTQLPNLRWRLASSFPKTLPTLYGASEVFAKAVSDLTGGRFQISTHPGGELVPALGVMTAVSDATVEACHTCPYYFFGTNEAFAFDCAIPFGMNSRTMTAWMFEGNGMKLMREFYANYNFLNFPMGNTGTQMGGWYRKEIKTAADIKGLKMRIGGFGGRILARLGGVPQNLPGSEVYSALERGTIDAVEWSGPYDDERLGFHKVAPFYYFPAWFEGSTQCSLYVNEKAYNALPPEYKAAVTAASHTAHITMQARYDAQNPEALKRLVGQGAKMRAMTNEVLAAAWKASQAEYAELNAKNPAWKNIYADYTAFQRNAVMWGRFSEDNFNSFMARSLRS